jgi:hypothetical protein
MAKELLERKRRETRVEYLRSVHNTFGEFNLERR